MTHLTRIPLIFACGLLLNITVPAKAQEAASTPLAQMAMPGGGGPVVVSPEVFADRHVTASPPAKPLLLC